jgi:hypothetical protein
MNSGARRVFAIGNAIIAVLLVAGGVALPLRHWTLYVPLGALALVVATSAVLALAETRWADRGLRVAALALLSFGLLIATAAGLTVAFLSGIHGQFLRHGMPLMLLTVAILVPYVFVYPVVLLAWLSPRDTGNVA